MKIIENENCVMFDVDGTLIAWSNPTEPGEGKIQFNYGGTDVFLTPHKYHIDLLKVYKQRGYHITVSSANGYRWALDAVKKLNLVEHVDIVSTKYSKYIDDTQADKWMTQVYIEDFYAKNK